MTVYREGCVRVHLKEPNAPMKRDNEFIRQLLLEYEQGDDIDLVVTLCINPSSDELKRYHHVELLCDAGYFIRIKEDLYRMTNQGYDYLEVIKNEDVWAKTKEAVPKLGGATLGMMKDIAVALIKREAEEKLGIIL